MELVEIRDLDGPNLFALEPTIKIEIVVQPNEMLSSDALGVSSQILGLAIPPVPIEALACVVGRLHASMGQAVPEVGRRDLDRLHHVAVFYPWKWRSSALLVATLAVQALQGGLVADPTPDLRFALERDRQENDRPVWVRDVERRIATVGITGTNGKTSTTRLIAHIARSAGKRTGWCSSTGVYIDGELVLDGDYTGPTGARRVLHDPAVEIAVLETARGGILLRGVAYESNDVGVMLNITADHLSLQGVETLDTLAEVKSVVVRVTRPDGLVVLNADDPRVLAQRRRVRAPILLTSQNPSAESVQAHLGAGGRALVRDDDAIALAEGSRRSVLVRLADVPVTFGGLARHMVENALAAAGAALGLGFTVDQVADGLKSFLPDVRSNPGRLNVFRLAGKTVVVDYAHNESGLEALLDFTARLNQHRGRVLAIIGTAGDRQDDVLFNLGRIAAERAERTYLKANPKYLRGRPAGEPLALMRAGVVKAGGLAQLAGSFPSELDALRAALEDARSDDAIAVMCVEDQLAILRELRDRGAKEWT